MLFLILSFCFLFCIACTNEVNTVSSEPIVLDSLVEQQLQYAKNFTVEKQDGYTLLTIKEGWKNSQQQYQYLLYPKALPAPSSHPNAIKIGVPVERILCTSTVDIAFLDFVSATDKIVAISNAQYVYNQQIHAGIEQQKMMDIGGNSSIDFERALTSNSEIAFVYSIGDQSNTKKFREMGIPPVMLSDFMEESPLGRAEWAVFVSYFVGKEQEAIQKFKHIARQYESLKAHADTLKTKPSILTGAVYKGTWHVAGGKSLMAKFLEDAGANYLWSANEEVSGVPLDFEAVYGKALEADIWINMSHKATKSDLLAAEARYADFEAFQKGQLFNYYKRSTKDGGSDIFESGIVHPHLILRDLIFMFHSETVDENKLYYYTQLK